MSEFKWPEPDEIAASPTAGAFQFPEPDEVTEAKKQTREQRAESNIKIREGEQKKKLLDLWRKNVFGTKGRPGLVRMFPTLGSRGQEKIMDYIEEHPSVVMTPSIVPSEEAGMVKFEPGGKVDFQKLLKQPTPPPGWVPEPDKPPEFGKGDIIVGAPQLKAGEPEHFTAGGTGEQIGGRTIPGKPGKPTLIPLLGSETANQILGPAFNLFVDLPFRTIGGTATGLYRGGKHLVEGGSAGVALEKAGDAIGKSVTDEEPAYLMTLGIEIGEDALGRELTIGESILFGGLGLVAELWMGPKIYPKVGHGPMSPNVAKQIGKTMKKVGAGKQVYLDAQALEHIMEAKTFPEMLRRAESTVANMAEAAKVDPTAAVNMFRRIIGPHGKHMGKEMVRFGGAKFLHPTRKKAIPEALPADITGIKKGIDPVISAGELVPHGARRGGPGAAKAAVGAASWGRGTARGVSEAVREAGSVATRGEEFATQGRGLNKMLGGVQESKQTAVALDMAEFGARTARRKGPMLNALKKVRKQQDLQQVGIDAISAKMAKMEAKRKGLKKFKAEKGKGPLWSGMKKTEPKTFWSEVGRKAWNEKNFQATEIGRVFREEFKQIKSGAGKSNEAFANTFRHAMEGRGPGNFPKTHEAIADWAKRNLPNKSEFLRNAWAGKPITQIDKLTKAMKKLKGEGYTPSLLRASKLERKGKKIEKVVADMEAGYQKALATAGVTEEQVVARLHELSPKQAEGIGMFRKAMDKRYGEMAAEGIPIQYLEGIIPHIETPKSLKKHIKTIGDPRKGAGKTKHAKHRAQVQAGVGLGGTTTREFEPRLGEIYTQYMSGTSIALANARSENILLKEYGRRITRGMLDKSGKNLLPEVEAQAKAQGLAIYNGKIGHYAGEKFLLDAQTARFLKQMVDPSRVKEFIKITNKYLNWWKARATITRPGFMVRNILFGNLYQEWLAGVDILKSNVLAAKAQSYMKAKQDVWGGKKLPAKWEKRLAQGGPKIGKYTFEEAVDLALEHKAFGGGMFGQELMGAVKPGGNILQNINPFGKQNALMKGVQRANRWGEDNARLAIFFDALSKGYTPQESAARIARFIFNYDEMTAFGNVMRQAFPFWTWTAKNWGLQASVAAKDMGKTATAVRGLAGVNQLDPLTAAEEVTMLHKADFMTEQGAVKVPGLREDVDGDFKWVLGLNTDEAPPLSRAWTLTANLLPVTSALQMMSPKTAAKSLGGMLHPFLKMGIEQFGYAPSIHWGTPFQRSSQSRRLAPSFVGWMMKAAKKIDAEEPLTGDRVQMYPLMTRLFEPIHDPVDYAKLLSIYKDIEKLDPEMAKAYDPDIVAGEPLGYTWPSWLEYGLHSIDPGLALFNRIFRENWNEDVAGAALKAASGLSVFPYGEKQIVREGIRSQYELQDWMIETFWNNIKHGRQFKTGNPNATIFPMKKGR